jgi:hypothetical protein
MDIANVAKLYIVNEFKKPLEEVASRDLRKYDKLSVTKTIVVRDVHREHVDQHVEKHLGIQVFV